ncbi:MAG: glycosyltransferase [Candidatus Ornithospirochaeta sp.]
MDTILVISYNSFSLKNANGMTILSLMSAYSKDNLIQFCRSADEKNFDFARSYFCVTDREMLSSFFFKKVRGIYDRPQNRTESSNMDMSVSSAELSKGLRKNNYNFVLRWLRELLWIIAPWGKRKLLKWVKENNPQAIVYMVGESISNDIDVLRIAKKCRIPLVLYNCEGYRTIDIDERKGIEKLFYKTVEKSYKKLQRLSGLVIYNCGYIMNRYQAMYKAPEKSIIAYNSSSFDTSPYLIKPNKKLIISYFGNLGVGRVASIIEIADFMMEYHTDLKIDVYGRPSESDEQLMSRHPVIVLHGFVGQDTLLKVRENSDILLHTESFDPDIVPKLKNAFSTKIAQCLCSGRCLFTYAPIDMASTDYLLTEDCACVASSKEEMKAKLNELIENPELRLMYANRALNSAKKNHDKQITAELVKKSIGDLL